MAEVCLTYLNFDSIDELSPGLDCAPVEARLLQYASSYWGLYTRNGLTEGVKSLALQLLSKFGRRISAKLLLWGNFAKRDRRRRCAERFTGVHCAGYFGLDEIAPTLLEEMEYGGADMVDGGDRTPLMWPAESGHEGMVKLLLDRKEVNPDSKENYSTTPLLRAAEGGHEGIVKLLLDREEVNPDSEDHYCKTPLLFAVMGGHEGIVKLLFDRKEVNPNSLDVYGTTPLMCAAEGGHAGIVKLLLGRKLVNPHYTNNHRRTALWLAANAGHDGIVKLLQGRLDAQSVTEVNYSPTSSYDSEMDWEDWL